MRHRFKHSSEKSLRKHSLTTIYSVVVWSLISLSSINAQDIQLGGYVKNLTTYTDGNIDFIPIEYGQLQNTSQLRLNFDWYLSNYLTFTAQSRNLFTYQKNIKATNSYLNLFSTSGYYFDLNYTLIDSEDLNLAGEIDRLHLSAYFDNWQITAGRQRIAWGTCLVWNPTDFFNPFDILDFDYEERPGTDALHVQYFTGPLSQAGLAISPGKIKEKVVYAFRYLFNQWNYDFGLIAGWQRNGIQLGMNWAGQIADGGFRGELLYSKPDYDIRIPIPSAGFIFEKVYDQSYWTAALSADYTFSNSLYLHTEYLYNGLGVTKNAGLRRLETLLTGELSPAKHSIYQEMSYDITPLLRGTFFVIYNPTDFSWIAAPSLKYSLANNWEVYLLAFPSNGDPNSEFGDFPTQYFGRVKFSF